MKLMGVDVGFSTTRLTTEIACLDGDQLSLARTGTAWESRKTGIPGGFQPTLIALDGPLLMSELGRVRSPSGPEFQSRTPQNAVASEMRP